MTKKQSSRQIDVLKYIYEQVEERGYPPTVREIGEAVNLSSTSTVHGHLSRLEKKGLILRDPTKPRAIELTDAEKQEQKELREEYIERFRGGMRNHIEGMKVVDNDGNDVTPDKLKEIQKNKGLHGR